MIGKVIEGVRVALNRDSSDAMVRLAQRALRRPETLSPQQIKSLAASVLSQAKPGSMRDEGDVA